MKKELTGVALKVKPLVDAAVLSEGCTLWDIDYLREGADYVLRITLDTGRDGAVDIEDCERVHRALDPLLDEADPIENSYYLQVSSPGVERDITLPRHVEALTGERVEVRLFAPINKSRVIVGTLDGMNAEGAVLITREGEQLAIPYGDISKMKLLFDFSNI